MVRFVLVRSGGFAAVPGLEQESVVDTDALAPAEAGELLDLAAGVDHRLDRRPRRGAADHAGYHLTVDDGTGPVRELRFPDPVDDPLLAELVGRLRALAGDPAGGAR